MLGEINKFMNNNFKKNQKGLSMLETIINIYVYVLLITICMTVAITYLKTRVAIRQKQQIIEELSITINEMAKKIRMSDCSGSTSQVPNRCINNSGANAITFLQNTGIIPMRYSLWNGGLYISENDGWSWQLMLDNVGGDFSAINTAPTNEIPLITMYLYKIKNGVEISGTRVKTSVSLRSGYTN